MPRMFRLTIESDAVCISELRMDRATFRVLCQMVWEIGGLKPIKNTSIEEKAYITRLSRCKVEMFSGALDGTLIKVMPPSDEKSRYRTRKGCSAHDSRVLRDAILRPQGLRVLHDCYYLVDVGYCNANGFLAPCRGQRYHLKEFNGHQPAQEYLNMKHSKTRNVIERSFGLLKGRWKIVASPFILLKETQIRIIMACCLLHNLIQKFMSHDPQESVHEEEEEEEEYDDNDEENEVENGEVEYVTNIGPSDE
ncbi:ALP1-like protein [Tanacetum coccineum]|uniref:ALP1-like protein n=1 Tax=Tanacetum coccineum TaxID=301880 RepID=A0ABQ5D496_9ASTR